MSTEHEHDFNIGRLATTSVETPTHDKQSHDVRYFAEAMARAAQIVGQQEGLDTKLLGALHLLNWYAERARDASARPAVETPTPRTCDLCGYTHTPSSIHDPAHHQYDGPALHGVGYCVPARPAVEERGEGEREDARAAFDGDWESAWLAADMDRRHLIDTLRRLASRAGISESVTSCNEIADALAARLSSRPATASEPTDAERRPDRWLADGYTDNETPLDGYGREIVLELRAALRSPVASPSETTDA